MSTESHNPDDKLNTRGFIMKYQLKCTDYFGPKYAFGAVSVSIECPDPGREIITVYARVRPAYRSTIGKMTSYNIDPKKFAVWRKNVNLYEFISVKS